jgi:3-hydroxyisobutyrate dehydrogenase-like beta-hydroxyacid dehydrogenase
MTRVGFIGLGSQGAPMARRIVEAGYPLTIWARRAATVEPFKDTAASVASTPAELGAASDIVGICVVADADVEDVLLGSDGVIAGMAPGGIVAIHSTIHPDSCRRLADQASEVGVAVIDAPVSGGGGAAAERKLLVMAGGEQERIARCRPVFETYSDPVIHLGPIGSGQVAKLLNNLVFTAQIAVALETYSLGSGLGLDRAALAQVLANGSGGSRAASILAYANFDLSGLRAVAAPLLRKDVGLMVDVARDQPVSEPTALMELARRALAMMSDEEEQ